MFDKEPGKQLKKVSLVTTLVAWVITNLTKDRSDTFIRRMQMILVAITILLVTLALSYPNLKQNHINLSEDGEYAIGRSAPETLVAVTDIEFLREQSYEKAKVDARNSAPLHISKDYGLLRNDLQYSAKVVSYQQLLKSDLEVLKECRSRKGWEKIHACTRQKSRRWRRLTLDEFREISYLPVGKQTEMYNQAMNLVFAQFSILKKPPTGTDKELYKAFSGDIMFVHNLNHSSSAKPEQIARNTLIKPNKLYTALNQRQIANNIKEHIRRTTPKQREALTKLSTAWLYGLDAIRIDPKATLEEQQLAIKNLKRSDHKYKIKRGQVILKKGDSITEEMRRSLELHQEKRNFEIVKRILSILIQITLLTFLMLYFALKFSHNAIKDLSSNLIIFSTIWLFALMLLILEKAWAAGASEFELTHFFGAWVPIGIFVVLLAIIFGEKLAIPFALYLSFLVFIASKYDGLSLVISMIMSLVATIIGARVIRRSQFISTALTLSILNLLLVWSGYLFSNRPIYGSPLNEGFLFDGFEKASLVALASGLATIAVIGLLPVYEIIFNVPTRFRLQELADTSHPLLKELFQRAPSTWTHTMMVAALTDKACERLNLNTMLARTGVYFHDIGKMKNAGFFVENKHLIPRDENINKDRPHTAAKVIIEHVTDGLLLAQQHGLPKEVIAFIPEHHGTSTMAFFYHQALTKQKRKVDRNAFRYPGPIPQSKETAIVMIADSVEAASRSLDEVNETTLNALIQKIINIKLSENQLDDSGITIGDLSVIREAFKDVLISSYHSRPKYPDQKSTAKLEESKNKPVRKKKKVRKKSGIKI